MSIRFRSSVIALLALGLATTAAPAPKKQQADSSTTYDRRASMRFSSAMRPAQRKALSELREDLGGSLLESIDSGSGVTRSLYNPVGKLTAPFGGQPLDVALDFAHSNLSLLGLEAGDLDEMEICDVVYSAVTGATHIYFCQRHQGLPIFNAQLHVNVSGDGSIISVNNSFVPGLESNPASVNAAIGDVDACFAVANHLEIPLPEAQVRDGVIDAALLSTEPIEAELMWLPMGADLKLVYRFQVHTTDGQHVYDVTVDAEEGYDPYDENRVMTRFDLVSPGLYQVYEMPVESPNHASPLPPADGRSIVLDPEDPIASPLGWHDTGTASYTIMRGNNVHAYDDIDANDAPPASEPDCGSELNCSFPIDLTQNPYAYTSAAVANLFYWTNLVHDVQYRYGFDEAAGNFQFNNFGKGGLGGDDVRAEAQDGSGFDNANFTTAVDGQRPKIQMFLWSLTAPLGDGDLDAGIVVHEYGHGISTRLVGGPSTVSCLSNFQQPGEGLSDWWSLVYTAKPSDTGPQPRGIGTYVLGELPDGFGIRTQRYSTSPTVNTHTYESIAGMAIPHGVGEVWAQAAWEVYWALVETHGFDPDLHNPMGGAGNQRMMLYVNEGLKNTACSPTFTDVRDGIIQAAADNYGGEDVCRMWEAFADFGLGVDAVSGDPWSTAPTNGFQVPQSCLSGPRITSPPPRTQLSSTTVTFEWFADGENVTNWQLQIGSSLGESDIFDSNILPATTLSTEVTNLPKHGGTIHARLWYEIDGVWSFKDFRYTALLGTPSITSPVPDTVLAASDQTFTWDADGAPVDQWRLWVGSALGLNDLFDSGTLTSAVVSADVTGLPTDSRTLHVRLQYLLGGNWSSTDYTYTAADLVPSLSTPTPGTVLSGSDASFSWSSNGAPITTWRLYLESTPNAADIFYSGNLTGDVTSADVTGIPTDGRTIHVRLVYLSGAVWNTLDYQFTAATLVPALSSPTPGTVLPGPSATFSWTSNGAAVTTWRLYVETSPGAGNIFYSGNLTGDVTSANVTGIHTDGRPIYARLVYLANSIWTTLDFQYTAATMIPELSSPTPSTVLAGSDVTFTWTSNGAAVTTWRLSVGTSVGGSNLYYSGNLTGAVLSATATGLPTDNRTIYVRLTYVVNGVWNNIDYVYTAANLSPALLEPTPNTELPGSSINFSWTSNGAPVTTWRLYVGTVVGSSNIFYSGNLTADVTSASVTDIPTDSSTIYVRLLYVVNGVWKNTDYTYTAAPPVPEILSPLPGSQLPGAAATFTWTTNGAAVTEWRLLVGSSVGASDLHDSLPLAASTLSTTVTGLPLDERPLFVRLSYVIDGTVSERDVTYTAGRASPEITSPVPGSVLTGPDVTFGWTANGVTVDEWRLIIGNSLGANDLHDSGSLGAATLSDMVSGLPVDGRTLFVQLQSKIDGVWENKDVQYEAYTAVPEIETPVPGTVLPGADATFTWTSNGLGVTTWRLYVGTGVGASNIYYSGDLTSGVSSADVTGIHTDGRTIYVRLTYLANGVWTSIDYQYTAATLIPEIASPTPGTVLAGPDVTFNWTPNGAVVTTWRLYVGTLPGYSNLYYSGNLTSDVLSADVTGLPTDNSTIYVRLYYVVNGLWKNTDYVYTAANMVPALETPTPGTVLPGSTVTFSWTTNGAPVTTWRLYVGTLPGYSNIHYSGNLTPDVTSREVTGIPTNGSTIYVRLYYVVNGLWKSIDYQYTASST